MGKENEQNQNDINTDNINEEVNGNLRPWDIALGRKKVSVFTAPDNRENIDIQQNRCKSYNELFELPSSIRFGITQVIHDIHANNQSVEDYADDYAQKIYDGKRQKSYDEFCETFGIPEEEKISQDEIDHRKALSAASVKEIFNYQERRIKGTDFELPKDSGKKMNLRVFFAVMCDPGAENIEKNKAVAETMFNGTAQEKTKLIENRFKELMKRADNFLGKTFTDEELLDHTEEILQVGVSAGMEMDGFNTALEELKSEGVKLSSEVTEKMAAYREKIYPYMNYYSLNMDYMTSPYYMYGGKKQLEQYPKLESYMTGREDFELAKTTIAIQGLASTGIMATGDKLVEMLEANGKKIETFCDTQGQDIGKDTYEMASTHIGGGELLFKYENDTLYQKVNLSNMEDFIPTISSIEPVTDIEAYRVQKKSELLEKNAKVVESFLSDKLKNALGAEFNNVKVNDAITAFTSHGDGKGKSQLFEKNGKKDCAIQIMSALENGEKVFIHLPNTENKTTQNLELEYKDGKPSLSVPERERESMQSSLQKLCQELNATGETKGDSKEFKAFKQKLNAVTKIELPKDPDRYRAIMDELASKAFAYRTAKMDQHMNARRAARFDAANQLLEIHNASFTNQKPNKSEMYLNLIATKMLKSTLNSKIKKGSPDEAQKAKELLGDYNKFNKESRKIAHSNQFMNMFKNMNSKDLEKFARKDSRDIVKFISNENKKAEKTKSAEKPEKSAPDLTNSI